MEFLIVIGVSIILCVVLGWVFGKNLKQLKKMADRPELDEIANQYPSNLELGKEYLQKLNHENVLIEENKDANTTMYIAISNKIVIANLKDSYTRIQTIAHECLHSIQNRKILMFNFVFSNVYLLYFAVISLLGVIGILPYKMMFLCIFVLLGTAYCMVRNYLENDAMIKARYLAKEYMEEKQISSKEEIEVMVKQYDKINEAGIPLINFQFVMGMLVKVMILSFIFLIR